MTTKIKNWLTVTVMAVTISNASCTLDEYNPSGYTMDALSASVEGYQTILNNVYFGMERALYGYGQFMQMTEGGTDIWTSQKNGDNLYLKYGMGSDFANNMMANTLNCCYDGICYCNQAIVQANKVPFTTEEEKNQKVAEAHFMRAVYYYNLVEQLGGVTLQMSPVEDVDLHPGKDTPLDIYEKCIIPDLEFAVQWLPVEERTTRPSKKSAMGMLARACLQSIEYDSSKKYAQRALEVAKEMVEDCKAGGAALGVYMYDNIEDVFAESNNFENKEALWKHRYVVGGVSNQAWIMNQNNEQFYCPLTAFSAIVFKTDIHSGNKYDGLSDYQIWGRRAGGSFMPSKHLMDLYVQEDGTLDPRYHEFFQTQWTCNKDKGQSWSESQVKQFDKNLESPEISEMVPNATTGFIPFGKFISSNGTAYEIHLDWAVAGTSIAIAVISIAIATAMYARAKQPVANALARRFRGLWTAAYHRFYIDEVYQFVTHKIIFGCISRPIAWFDHHVVDGFFNFLAWSANATSDEIRGLQSGQIQQYTYVFLLGTLALILLLLL